ncbi:MAG: DUF4406 domain-containing protein [Alkaliphilus sp.]|nr:DUF4406 domain-containing protein [Alkaliphilus sp.]
MKKRVFVSHPFVDNPSVNRIKADMICRGLLEEGYLPISPLHLFGFYNGDEDRKDILQFCYKLIDSCDIVHVYGESEGCLAELEYAIKIGKPWRVIV